MWWRFLAPKDAVQSDARVTWNVEYVMDADQLETMSRNRKIQARFLILKDDILSVLPISKVGNIYIVTAIFLWGQIVNSNISVLPRFCYQNVCHFKFV